MKAIRVIWIVTTPIVGVGFFLSMSHSLLLPLLSTLTLTPSYPALLIRKYGLQRKVEVENKKGKDEEREIKGKNEEEDAQKMKEKREAPIVEEEKETIDVDSRREITIKDEEKKTL